MSNIKIKVKGNKKKNEIIWRKSHLGNGSVTVDLGNGNDYADFRGSNHGNKLYGGKGNDTLLGGKGDDVIVGGKGNDMLRGYGGDDTINGGKGNDTIVGGKGDDVIYTGKGKNTIVINKGDGNDTIYAQGSKTLISFDEFKEFDSNLSFNKRDNDLEMVYTHSDNTKEVVTLKNYFTSNGKIADKNVYLKTQPAMVVPMYAVPFIEPPEETLTTWQMQALKYAPPPFLSSDDTTETTDTSVGQAVTAVPKYAIAMIGEEPELITTEIPGDLIYVKYAPPPYGFTRSEVEISSLLAVQGLTLNANGSGKYRGTDFDDTINGSNGSDTIIAGKGNDKIHANKGNDVINAGKGINILYFNKNDGKNTVLNGKGTDIIIIENEKFSNLKVKFSGNNAVITYTGGEIILKDYKKGGHSAQYIQAGNTRRKIDTIINNSIKTSKNSDANYSAIKSETTGWIANKNDDASNIISPESENTNSINILLGSEYTDKLPV